MDESGPAPSLITARISAVARRQHGVITRAQILATGVTGRMVERRLETGRLIRLHRGVYLLGHLDGGLEPQWAREMAAALAFAPSGVVSHRTAARLWKIIPESKAKPPIEITVTRRRPRRRPRITSYGSPSLASSEVTRLKGIPVTKPSRTLRDLASIIGVRELSRAAARAERLGLMSSRSLLALPARYRGRRGSPVLAAALGSAAGLAFTRSEAEERLLALIRNGRLPQPKVNARLLAHEVDFLWADERLVVEVDGFAYHMSRRSFEHDRRRDAELAAAGYRVLRLTWRQVTEEAETTLVRLAQALVRSSRPSS